MPRFIKSQSFLSLLSREREGREREREKETDYGRLPNLLLRSMVRACGRDEQNLIYLISSSSRAPSTKSLNGPNMKWNRSLLKSKRTFRTKARAWMKWNYEHSFLFPLLSKVSLNQLWRGKDIVVSYYLKKERGVQGDMDKGNQLKP